MKKLLMLTLFALSLSLSGCATIDGFGQDVSATGYAIQDTMSGGY